MWQKDGRAPIFRIETLGDVLNKSVVGGILRWHAPGIASVGVAGEGVGGIPARIVPGVPIKVIKFNIMIELFLLPPDFLFF